jgi:hypothetical protein
VRLVSVNVGQPRLVEWRGEVVETGIFKEPVTGPVMVTRTDLAGDRQADLTVHGLHSISSEHYPFWSGSCRLTAVGDISAEPLHEGLDKEDPYHRGPVRHRTESEKPSPACPASSSASSSSAPTW